MAIIPGGLPLKSHRISVDGKKEKFYAIEIE